MVDRGSAGASRSHDVEIRSRRLTNDDKSLLQLTADRVPEGFPQDGADDADHDDAECPPAPFGQRGQEFVDDVVRCVSDRETDAERTQAGQPGNATHDTLTYSKFNKTARPLCDKEPGTGSASILAQD